MTRRLISRVAPWFAITGGCMWLLHGTPWRTVFGAWFVVSGAVGVYRQGRTDGRTAARDLGLNAREAADLARAGGEHEIADELVRYADARRLPGRPR